MEPPRKHQNTLSTQATNFQLSQSGSRQVSLAFLRQMETAGCISQNGHIRGRLEEDYEGVPLCASFGMEHGFGLTQQW